jgi:hypothetical protein
VSQDRFAGIRFVLKHRSVVTVVLASAPLLIGAWFAARFDTIDFAILGLVLAPAAWLFVRVLLELLDVVSETLFPR